MARKKNDMSCVGLTGKKLKKCMKAYVKQSKRLFPTFNQATDTVSTTASSNHPKGITLMRDRSRNPKIRREVKNSISEPKIVRSSNKKDTHPYKLKTHRRKN